MKEKSIVRETIKKLEDKLDKCVIFKECRFCKFVSQRVKINKSGGCSSNVGYYGPPQQRYKKRRPNTGQGEQEKT